MIASIELYKVKIASCTGYLIYCFMKEIVLYKSRWSAIKMILLCSVFVVPGLWMILIDHKPDWRLWLAIGFFSLGYPVGIIQLLDRRPQVIFNEKGFQDRRLCKEFINWESVEDAYIRELNGLKFIALVLNKPLPSAFKKMKLYKSVVRFNQMLGFQELNISASELNVNAKSLLRFILLMKDIPQSERGENILLALEKGLKKVK